MVHREKNYLDNLKGWIMKVGLIRCLQTENLCPATKCFLTINEKKGAFKDIDEDIHCIAVNTCGGCPGKNTAERAKRMVKQGAEAIVVSSCITLGSPMDFPCPFHHKIIEIVKKAVGDGIRVFEYSHEVKK